MIGKIKIWLKFHKIKAALLIVAIFGGWYYYQNNNEATAKTSYVLAQLERSPLIVTISGSGQVSNSNQLDLKPKVSAEIKMIKVKAGQKIKKGDSLAVLDNKNLVAQLRQAKNSLAIAKANLAVKLAGVTAEEILVSQRQVDTAKLAYENSKLSLENTKLNNAENISKAQISLSNAQIGLDNAQRAYDGSLKNSGLSKDDSNQSLINAYSNAKSTINTTIITLRSALVAADSILGLDNAQINAGLKNVLSIKDSSYLIRANDDYRLAKNNLASFNAAIAVAGSDWSYLQTDQLLNQAVLTLQAMSVLETDTHSVLLNSIASNEVSQASLDSYKSSIASQVSAVNSAQNSIQSVQQNIISAKSGLSSSDLATDSNVNNAKASLETAKNNMLTAQSNYNQTKLDVNSSLVQAQSSLANAKNSYETAQAQHALKVAKPRAVDIASMRLQISQAEDSYKSAADDLAEAVIKSPIAGTVAKIYQKVGDMGGSATTMFTLTTSKQLAAISLNEVDAAKVKAGQKSTMTFSAVDNLEITGEVAEIDTLGTVTSGVVTYNVNIAFDTQDERIKPGMSVSAVIVIDQKIDALSVSNSAIKTDSSGATYVQVLNDATAPAADGSITSVAGPVQKTVVIGLANDTNTEIVSGLNEGDTYILKTITSSSATASAQQSGLSSLFGGNRGGATRAMGGGVTR